MSFKVYWDESKHLRLSLSGNITLAEFIDINKDILAHLEDRQEQILLIDAIQARILLQGADQVRASQTYLQNHSIRHLFVVTSNKITRLALFIMFSMSKTSVMFFDTYEQMQKSLDIATRQQLNVPASANPEFSSPSL